MSVKTQFSIKDLENLSGVKAHTIRIWEKRYNVLSPERSNTNIRQYDLLSLKRLLNVTHLYNKGHKISKIAGLKPQEINKLVYESRDSNDVSAHIKDFKEAMLAYDNNAFIIAYNQASANRSFSEVFFQVFIPLLEELGTLWHIGAIDPSHERFISELIKQKIVINIVEAQKNFVKKSDRPVALFLPLGELHDIGLLYTNYILIEAGFKTIFLGSNIPLKSLNQITNHHNDVLFVTYLTTAPKTTALSNYFDKFIESVYKNKSCELWCLGRKTQEVDAKKLPKQIKIIKGVKMLKDNLKRI